MEKDEEEVEEEVEEETKPKLKKKKEEPKLVVVKKLPTQPVRSFIGEDDKEYEVITESEAITEILKTVRELKKLL